MKRWPLSVLLALLVVVVLSYPAEAKHQPILPGICGDVRNCPTPQIAKARAGKVLTYRLDAGTAAYPNFSAQAAQVVAAAQGVIGVKAIEITSGVPDLWLTFPDDATFISICGSGAAACIQYWADPIMVYFRRALLYPDWRTGQSHEGINAGHALGEGEEYYDQGELRCDTTATWTIMSCGTGVWIPQAFDIALVCSIVDPHGLQFVGCGFQPLPPPRPLCNPPNPYPYWDGTRCIFEDGWQFQPNTADGQWYDPQGRLVWDAVDRNWNGRYSPVCHGWYQRGLPGGSMFCDSYGWVSLVVP